MLSKRYGWNIDRYSNDAVNVARWVVTLETGYNRCCWQDPLGLPEVPDSKVAQAIEDGLEYLVYQGRKVNQVRRERWARKELEDQMDVLAQMVMNLTDWCWLIDWLTT